MKTAAILINVTAFAVLFFDYAVAMEPLQPGTRRFLQVYAGQLSTGAYPTLEPALKMQVHWSDQA